MTEISVRRVDFGYFVRPVEETGTGSPRAEPCLGHLIDHPDGLLLVDTGMGEDEWVDGHCRPRRIPLRRAVGVDLDDIATWSTATCISTTVVATRLSAALKSPAQQEPTSWILVTLRLPGG